MSEDKILVRGEIIETLPATTFSVELESGVLVLGFLSGLMKKNFIKVVCGDWVKMELSPYDLTKGRIVERLANQEALSLAKKKRSQNES